MTKLKNIFQRKETKYMLDQETYHQLRTELQNFVVEDEYGLHTIISLYYDNQFFDLIKQSIEKPTYREKFRIRSYGVPKADSPVFFEIKKKVKGIVYKRRIDVDYKSACHFDYTSQKSLPIKENQQQIMSEIDWMMSTNKLYPRVMIAYDRIALKPVDETLEDFRITFDFDIRYRDTDLDISLGDYGSPVAPEFYCLMEVKSIGSYPLWFSHVLSEFHIQKGSFSKYATTYKRYLIQEEKQYAI